MMNIQGVRVRLRFDDEVPERRGGGGVTGGEQERGRHHVRADIKSTGKSNKSILSNVRCLVHKLFMNGAN